ncbi:hypothetical protein PLEOSDRAFT_1043945 [Pleurotus ostreatus PC15]|uniref:Uncharacterized protein n=1 Tax=Pleurotus ostreatus (strain PC15) TaxID=1137138 RepID=A0A067NU57_PLEO1|nr:hypothetical protein PLEOSDRAFT_1043945 [Pleurotus ostreatus PC15]
MVGCDENSKYGAYQNNVFGATAQNPWAPFTSKVDWEVARWAKLRGSGSTAFSDLLGVENLCGILGLSYKTTDELNKIIDTKIPNQRPKFTHRKVEVSGQSFDLFSRDIIECVKALYQDPEHSAYLCFSPERHYADADKTERLYHEMNTGKWWWSTQEALEATKPGATIIPIIISSDKTQLTLFRDKTAYPVYLTIGNLPKSIRRKPSRRGQILLAYLPTSKLKHIQNKSSRRRALANMFHASMKYILSPLKEAGIEGVRMVSGDHVARRCHPIFAAYVGDYPEQCLVTGAFNGDCPICECPNNELGEYPSTHMYRTMDIAFAALEHSIQHDYAKICKSRRLKPLRDPFWEDLPFVNIFAAITPDILHQLHQGVMKHLIGWITTICHPEEIDERVKRLPPNHSIRIFHKGITSLSRVSGTEHKQITSFLLGLLTDIPLRNQYATARSRLISATRALLDFLYLAQYPLHSLVHYARAITLYGTTDNYSTESTERLHIDFAKDAYAATNHKDEFPQMTAWLERREKVLFHEKFIEWRLTTAATVHPSPGYWEPPDRSHALSHHLTKHPTRKAVPIELISSPSGYGATFFRSALARYLIHEEHPSLSQREVVERASDHTLPFDSLPVFHKLKFKLTDNDDTYDAIHAYPSRQLPKKGDVAIPQRFDTALVRVADKTAGSSSTTGLRVGRVRLIFTIPRRFSAQKASRTAEEVDHLAYIEWFSPLSRLPDANYRMYKISRVENEASVVPVSAIERSTHLYPKWGGAVCREWTSSNILDRCSTFFINPFKDHHTYYNVT